MLQKAYGVVTLQSGLVLECDGDPADLLAAWRPDNPVVSIVDPDPRGLPAEDSNVVLETDTHQTGFLHNQLAELNLFILDSTG